MKPLFSDSQAPLLRAVQRLLTAVVTYDSASPVAVIVESAISIDWASATFVGEQHVFELRLEPAFATIDITKNPARDRTEVSDSAALAHRQAGSAGLMAAVASFAATIGEADIELPRHFVAEIAIVRFSPLEGNAVKLTIEALTLLN